MRASIGKGNEIINLIMANNWKIPSSLEAEIRKRDKVCSYCGRAFVPYKVSTKEAASWEHIVNDISLITRENIVLCCCSCNSSKGNKPLKSWLGSEYASARGISVHTLSPIVLEHLKSKGATPKVDL